MKRPSPNTGAGGRARGRGAASVFEALAALIESYRQEGTVPLRVGSRKALRSHVSMAPPAAPDEIEQAEQALSCRLPDDYRTFLQRWNGGRLFVGNQTDLYPALHGTAALPQEQAVCDVPGVLIVGQLDDESYLFLDGRAAVAGGWPVYCGEFIAHTLKDPPIAASFAEFLDRYVSGQGAWYWEEYPLAWVQESGTWWRHGLGLYLSRDQWPVPCYRIGLPQPPFAVTPEALRMAVGLREHLISLGAQQVSPADLGIGGNGWAWWFRFASAPLPDIEPHSVAPAVLDQDGWQQLADGMWLHGTANVAYWVSPSVDLRGMLTGAYYWLTWSAGQGEAVALGLKHQLDQIGADLVREPERLPDGCEGVEYIWWTKPGRAEAVPDIRPV